jgi:hypothetical protein
MNSQRINSRQKGARGERQWRDELRAHGYDARRGQQFSGSPDWLPKPATSQLPMKSCSLSRIVVTGREGGLT